MPRPLLGPVAGPVLSALAAADDGLTVAAIADATGRLIEQRTAIDQAIRGLKDRGLVRVLRHVPRTGKPSAVWGITTAGREALAQSQEAVAP